MLIASTVLRRDEDCSSVVPEIIYAFVLGRIEIKRDIELFVKCDDTEFAC